MSSNNGITWRELRVGMILDSNKSSKFKVINVMEQQLVRIEFVATGFIKVFGREHVASGSVSDPYARTTLSIGYMGKSKNKERRKDAMNVWIRILSRYVKGECRVSSKWLNFSNFHAWYLENRRDGMYIMKINESSIYCPRSCVVVDKYERARILSIHRMNIHIFHDTILDIRIEIDNIRGLARKYKVSSGDIFGLISGRYSIYKGLIYMGVPNGNN